MSKNKGFSNTSAQRYSLALYELSSEADSLKVVEQHVLAILKLIQTSKDFYAIHFVTESVNWYPAEGVR